MEITHHHFETINSTNTWSKKNCEDFDRSKITVVTAEEQTSGRGRFNRPWLSPTAVNLYITFNFFLDNFNLINNIPQILALSTKSTLNNLNIESTLKWPNDILINGKKVAGILCETTPLGHQIAVILGMGININISAEELKNIPRPTTSLCIEKGISFNLKEIQANLEIKFTRDLEKYFKEGFSPFFEDFISSQMYKKGDKIQFHVQDKLQEGYFDSINTDGSIRIKLANGKLCNYSSMELVQ